MPEDLSGLNTIISEHLAEPLVGSQNWSTDGTLYNRDAGVIIEHPDAAQYFQQIFLHDWDHLATQKARSD